MPMIASNSPEHGHAPKQTSTARLSIWWILGALALGILTGAVGTVLHLNSWWTGSFGIPWGVGLALVIAGLAQWWIGLRTAHILAPGITGIAQYATVAAMVTMANGDHFSVPINAQMWDFLPHLVIAAVLWHVGIVVVTIVTVLRLSLVLRRTRAQLRAEYTPWNPSQAAEQNG